MLVISAKYTTRCPICSHAVAKGGAIAQAKVDGVLRWACYACGHAQSEAMRASATRAYRSRRRRRV